MVVLYFVCFWLLSSVTLHCAIAAKVDPLDLLEDTLGISDVFDNIASRLSKNKTLDKAVKEFEDDYNPMVASTKSKIFTTTVKALARVSSPKALKDASTVPLVTDISLPKAATIESLKPSTTTNMLTHIETFRTTASTQRKTPVSKSARLVGLQLTTTPAIPCSCENDGFCNSNGKCISCNDKYFDPTQNCTKCLMGREEDHCKAMDECKFPELFCPKGATMCVNYNGSNHCYCASGFVLDLPTNTCRLSNTFHVALSLNNFSYVPDFKNRTTQEFINISNRMFEVITALMRTSTNYIDSNLTSISQQGHGILANMSMTIWNRRSEEIDKITNAIKNYTLICQNECFGLPTSSALVGSALKGPCQNYPNLCANFPNTRCKDNYTFHIESMDTQYTCECALGFVGNKSFQANDGMIFLCHRLQSYCEPNPCVASGTCIDFSDSFQCICPWTRSGPTCDNPLPVVLVIATIIIIIISSALIIVFYFLGKNRENHIIITRQIAPGGTSGQQPPRFAQQTPLSHGGGGLVNQSFDQTELGGSDIQNPIRIPRAKLKDQPGVSMNQDNVIMERSF